MSTDEAVKGQLPVELNGNAIGLKFGVEREMGLPYYHLSVWLSSSVVYDEDGQSITDDDRVSLPYIQFVYDMWHKANGRYCTQSLVDGLVIRAPGVSDVDLDMVCETSNHLDAIEFNTWYEAQRWTWASDDISMTYEASRKVGEFGWNCREITFPTEYPRVNIGALMLSSLKLVLRAMMPSLLMSSSYRWNASADPESNTSADTAPDAPANAASNCEQRHDRQQHKSGSRRRGSRTRRPPRRRTATSRRGRLGG